MILIIKRKYKDIQDLYNFSKIEDGKVELIKNKQKKHVYIYKVTPITLACLTEEIQNEILKGYREFLREMNLPFQILLINKKLNIKEYLEQYNTYYKNMSNEKISNIYFEYIEDLKKYLKEEAIYETEYYIIISEEFNENIDIKDFDRKIFKLKNLSCGIKRIDCKDELTNILYEAINKDREVVL